MLVQPPIKVDIGIIGGSGLYELPGIQKIQELKVYTPYGMPSDNVVVGELRGRRIAFLARHGKGHKIPPHRVNYRANIWALKTLGAKWVISVSAVGSLREDYAPGDFVIPDQFIDMTKGFRQQTFFEGGVVAHVSMADPFCEHLRKIIIEAAREFPDIRLHGRGTYICIEGPRFSTRAESRVWKEVFKADIIGMTLIPEVNLACEAQLCYATIAMITDYDVWAEKPVTAEEVIKTMNENVSKVKKLLPRIIELIPSEPDEKTMQLLQKLRDSSTLEEFTSEILELENKARVFSKKILDFLTQSRGNIILYSYTGYGYTPASLMYWYSLTFQSIKHPVLTEAEESSIYLLPYRDDLSILIFSTGEYSKLIATLQVARVLGVDYLAIAPEPPTDNLKSIAKFYGVEQAPLKGVFETALFTTLASFFAVSELYKSGLEARGRRLFAHGQEGFAVTTKSFIEKYIGELSKIMEHDDIHITSTRFLEASTILLSHAIRELGKSAKYIPLEEALSLDAPLIAVFLTTEERVRRELKVLKQSPLIELLLNVDPLEGIVYLTLLSYIIARSKDM